MTINNVAVGDPITASKENEQTAQLNLQPTFFAVPTTSSGGVTVSANGLVTFSSVTSIVLDAAFSTSWRENKIIGAYQADSTLGTATMQLRTTVPATVTSASYDLTSNLARNATVASTTNNASPSTSWLIQPNNNKLNKIKIELSDVAVATETTGFVWSGSHADPSVQSTANGSVFDFITQADDTVMGGLVWTFTQASSGWLRILNIG